MQLIASSFSPDLGSQSYRAAPKLSCTRSNGTRLGISEVAMVPVRGSNSRVVRTVSYNLASVAAGLGKDKCMAFGKSGKSTISEPRPPLD